MKKAKTPDQMNEEELRAVLQRRYFFQEDEIKSLYPNESDVREAVTSLEQARLGINPKDEDEFGWDEDDKTVLTADQQREVDDVLRIRKRLEEIRKKRESIALQMSIDQAGGKVTAEECKAAVADAMADLRKELAELNEELDEAEGRASKKAAIIDPDDEDDEEEDEDAEPEEEEED